MSGPDAHARSDAQQLRALILAAGQSRRMGRAKAQISWRGRSFLAHVLAAAAEAGATERLVVGGALDLSEPARALGADYRDNTNWREGPTTSLQLGLASLGPGPVLVLSVDRPHLRAATLHALAAAVARDPTRIWQPAQAGRRGHPIVWPAALREALLALRPGQSPRDLYARPELAVLRTSVPVDDPAIFDNLDRPEDLARLNPPPDPAP